MLDRKKIIVAISLGILGFLILLVFLFVLTQNGSKAPSIVPTEIITAKPNENKVKIALSQVELADTELARNKGLMYRESLCQSCGMLFEFEKFEKKSFWMKNTKISLDMIFMDENGKITKIFENTTPENTEIFYTADAKYVLELNAGSAKTLGLSADMLVDILELKKKTIRLNI